MRISQSIPLTKALFLIDTVTLENLKLVHPKLYQTLANRESNVSQFDFELQLN